MLVRLAPAGLDTEHVGHFVRGVEIGFAGEVDDKINHVAAGIAHGEVRPDAGLHVDLEGSGLAVTTSRIANHPFVTNAVTAWQ